MPAAAATPWWSAARARTPTLAGVGPRSPALHFVPYGDLAAAGDAQRRRRRVPDRGHDALLVALAGNRQPAGVRRRPLRADGLRVSRRVRPPPGRATPSRTTTSTRTGSSACSRSSAPDEAQARRDVLVEVARAGDFAVTTSRTRGPRLHGDRPRYADPARSPLAIGPTTTTSDGAALHRAAGPPARDLRPARDLPRPVGRRGRHAQRERGFARQRRRLDRGGARRRPRRRRGARVCPRRAAATASAGNGRRACTPWPCTTPPSVCAVSPSRGRHYEFVHRYEGWVQFRSRAVRPRVDLAPLADRLTEAEATAGGPASWTPTPGRSSRPPWPRRMTPRARCRPTPCARSSRHTCARRRRPGTPTASPAETATRPNCDRSAAASMRPAVARRLRPLPSRPMFHPTARAWSLAALFAAAGALGLAACSSSPSTRRRRGQGHAQLGKRSEVTNPTDPAVVRSSPSRRSRRPTSRRPGPSGTAPTVTVPAGAPPTALESADLISGTGARRRPATRVKCSTCSPPTRRGKVIQSSWTSQPFTFTLGAQPGHPRLGQGCRRHEGRWSPRADHPARASATEPTHPRVRGHRAPMTRSSSSSTSCRSRSRR